MQRLVGLDLRRESRYLTRDLLTNGPLGNLQIMLRLQPKPECRRGPEEPGQPEGRFRREAAPTLGDLGQSRRWNPRRP